MEAEYRALKAGQSALDNNDLLRMAYEALRDYPAIRAAYEGRFKMVMIDEFQDTDQMQVDLIRYLTGAGERALCTVGDAQQSIYRFRGAEVEVFRRQERKVGSTTASETVATSDAPAGELVKLVRNFRSHDEVLRYVARVFDGDTGGLMQGFLDLEPSDNREDKLKAKASRRQALLVAGGSTQERTQAKARAIAERFQALVKAGQPQGGMVLLLGRMTNADVYAQAFRDPGARLRHRGRLGLCPGSRGADGACSGVRACQSGRYGAGPHAAAGIADVCAGRPGVFGAGDQAGRPDGGDLAPQHRRGHHERL